ncbi:hypothetical protein CC78DRAFT_586752 [Lojkania enalia]|uniref:Uncharacterized protein n=1 Tax=Lojkania enalia TaxID=147567 RepID=A0A9P4K112_9PLEO|nr:hypothetical protein CC78DRAFT_586752 [Didymosphaeria enalia]
METSGPPKKDALNAITGAPQVLLTPPSPIHAQTTNLRIVSPILHIPDHPPITTTLTRTQLTILFPTLHIFILPSHPSIALLPANSITYTGVSNALKWYEADVKDSSTLFISTIDGTVEIYQALAFMGNNVKGDLLGYLFSQIEKEIGGSVCLDDIKDVWKLRSLPFTEGVMRLVVRRLARALLARNSPKVQGDLTKRLDAEGGFEQVIEDEERVWDWVKSEPYLAGQVVRVMGRMEKERKRAVRTSPAKRVRRMVRKRSAVNCFESVLQTVEEETY